MTEFSFLANCSFNFFHLSLAPVNTRFKIFIAKTAKLISTRVGMLQAQVLHSNYGPVIEVSLSNKIQQVTQRVAVTTLNSSRGCKHTHTLLSVILLTQGKTLPEREWLSSWPSAMGHNSLNQPHWENTCETAHGAISVPRWGKCPALYILHTKEQNCVQTFGLCEVRQARPLMLLTYKRTYKHKQIRCRSKVNDTVLCNYLSVSSHHS